MTQTNEAEINCVLISNYINKLKETMDAGNIGADNTNKLAMALHVVNKEVGGGRHDHCHLVSMKRLMTFDHQVFGHQDHLMDFDH